MRRDRGSGLDRLWDVARRRKWLAAAVFGSVLAAGVTTAMSLPDIYRATATVLVEHRQALETLLPGELEARLQTISEEIFSRARLQGLIGRFGLYPDLRRKASPEMVVAQMRRDIRMEPKGVDNPGGRGATIAFSLSYRGRDPQTAAQVTNTLASFYVEEDLKIRERQASGTVQYLKTQLDEAKRRLDEQQARLSAFQERYLGELPEQTEANLSALERLNVQLRVNSEDRVRALTRREELTRRIGEVDPASADTAADAGAARLAKLQRELSDLRRRFSDKYPDVVRVKAEIAALESEAGSPPPQPAAPSRAVLPLKETLQELDAEIASLRADEARLRGEIAIYSRRVENAPRRQQELEPVSQDYRSTKELYDSLLRKYEEAQLSEGADPGWKRPRFRILDAAVAPGDPVAPNRLQLLLLALAASLAAAVGAVLLAEQLDRCFHTIDDLRAFTRVPILARVPPILTRTDGRRSRRRFWLSAAAAAVALVLIVQGSHRVAHGNYGLIAMMARGRS
jgi:protein tyrosine kinase modulator